MTIDRSASIYMDLAHQYAARAAKILTAHGETDEASMKTLAVLDSIDRAREEILLRLKATEEQGVKVNGIRD